MNVIRDVTKSLYSAIFKDFPDQERTWRGETKIVRPTEETLNVCVFPQTWSSTALGFGGIGGQAFTSAYTVVVYDDKTAAVYFNGGFAYLADINNDYFQKDLALFQLRDVATSSRYRRKG